MNIWTGLLFLEGAIADATLARELAGETPSEAPAPSARAYRNEATAERGAWQRVGFLLTSPTD